MYEYIQAYIKHLLPYLHLPGEKACRSSWWTHSMFLLLCNIIFFLDFFQLLFGFQRIIYRSRKMTVCVCAVGRISNYNWGIKFMAPPHYLPLSFFTAKHFWTSAHNFKCSIVLNSHFWQFYDRCLKILNICWKYHYSTKVNKDLQADIFILAMQNVLPVVLVKS